MGLGEARIDLSGFADGPRRRTAGAKRKTTSEHSRTFADNAFAAASKRSARDRSVRRPRAPPEGVGDAEPSGRPIVGKAAWKGSARRAKRRDRAGVSRRMVGGPVAAGQAASRASSGTGKGPMAEPFMTASILPGSM